MSLLRLSGSPNSKDRTTGPTCLAGRWRVNSQPASLIHSSYFCERKRPLEPLMNMLLVLGGNGSSITVMRARPRAESPVANDDLSGIGF